MTDTRRTALYDVHKQLKAKMVPFGGWSMPVSYTSVLAEHKAVRERCGLFDVSHMGEVFVTGADAQAFLQKVTVNDLARLKDGSGQYSALLQDDGGMIDDIIVYRLRAEEFLICVNASNVEKDYHWLSKQAAAFPKVWVTNSSADWSQIAVQGPTSKAAVETLIGPAAKPTFNGLEYMQIMRVPFFGQDAFVARTGYTGEWGYELYVPNEIAPRLWTGLMETADRTGIVPVGLGARDTLRLEACYLLYGNDMNETVSPLEAGIGWAVRLDKGSFIGRDPLIRQKETQSGRQMFAFKMEEDGIPRHDMDVYVGEELVGKVTSGSVLPTVGGAGGFALLKRGKAKLGDAISVDIRGKRKLARLVEKPLYKAKAKG
jgi:aminomethyltransferase